MSFKKNCILQGGERNNVQQYFSQLVLSIESYYHPSNYGKHTVSNYCCRHTILHLDYALFVEKTIAVFRGALITLHQKAETVCAAVGRMLS